MKAVLLAHRYRDAFVQLVTITAGVLIALFFDGLVEWNSNRTLAIEARTMIRREISDNKKELDGGLAMADATRQHLDTALRFADELLAKGSTDVRELSHTRSFAELNSSNWRTAEQTGALSHMDYEEVQRYSKIYALQDLFVMHQRRVLERVAAAIAIIATEDPYKTSRNDLEVFRQHLLAMRGDALIESDLGKALSGAYAAELKR